MALGRPIRKTHKQPTLQYVAIGLMVTSAILLPILLRNRTRPAVPEPPPMPMVIRGANDIVGGLPATRAEIEDYIARVRRESFDESLNNLHMNEPLLIKVGIYQNDPVVEAAFQRCLADRRLAKVYENLEKRDRAEARMVSSNAFSKSWQKYKKDINSGLGQWEANGGVTEAIDTSGNYYSLCATVFLVSAFGTHDDVLSAIDEWESFSTEAMQRVRRNPKLEPLTAEMMTFCPPQPLFLLNLYVWRLLDQCGHKSPEELWKGMTRRPLTTEQIAFTGWDGHTNFYDFTHQRAGVPIDEKRTLRTFTVCRSWLPGAVFTDEEKHLINNSLRQKVVMCSKK